MKDVFLKKGLFLGAISAAIVLGFSGCSDHTKLKAFNGKFVDNVVAGADFSCGDKKGVTDKNGVFGPCPKGSEATISLGGVVLGKSKETHDGLFTPQDLVGVPRDNVSDSRVKKLAAVVLSLDPDGDPSNGIAISPTLKKVLEEKVKENTGKSGTIDLTQLNESVVVDVITDVKNEIENNDTLKNQIKSELSKEGISVNDINLTTKTPDDVVSHLQEVENKIKKGEITPPPPPSDNATD